MKRYKSTGHLWLILLCSSGFWACKKAASASFPAVSAPTAWHTFHPINIDSINMPIIDGALIQALANQPTILRAYDRYAHTHFSNLHIDVEQLRQATRLLEYWQYGIPTRLSEIFDFYKIHPPDTKGEIYFTGYYTPTLSVSGVKTDRFPYPVYARPTNDNLPMPTRAAIYDGALEGRARVLCYAASLLDIYIMQVQGSGYIKYADGRQYFLAYDGTNGYRYKSLGLNLLKEAPEAKDISNAGIKKYFLRHPTALTTFLAKDPSFTFFKLTRLRPHGATAVPLTPHYSAAVDKNYLPLGGIYLAKLPQKQGDTLRYEYRFLVGQDVGGGAIHGPAHLDVYCGEGVSGKQAANKLHHYGELWLLLPKRKDYVTK